MEEERKSGDSPGDEGPIVKEFQKARETTNEVF